MSDIEKEQEILLSKIDRTDRLSKRFQLAFQILTILALVAIIVIQGVQMQKETDAVIAINKNTKEQLDTINRHLDCLVVYFGQPNRADLKITDINKCVLENSIGVQQFFDSATPSSKTTKPSAGDPDDTSVVPTSPNTTSTTPPVTTTAPPPAQQPNPVTVLGLRLCVLRLCINQ